MAKKKYKDDAVETEAPVTYPDALLVGNPVTGYTIYPLPEGVEADRMACHVPEARLVQVRPFDELTEKFGELPEPANTTPKTRPDDGDAGGQADGEDSGPAGGGQGGADDSTTE